MNTELLFVVPRVTPSNAFSSASSRTKLPCNGANNVFLSSPCAKVKPVLLPNAILHTQAAAPPSLTTLAESTLPSLTALLTSTISAIASSYFGSPLASSTGISTNLTVLASPLNCDDTVSLALLMPTANETRVGGTSSSLKLPLIESLPPIDGV